MNKCQKDYVVAKAALLTFEELISEIEREYIISHNITNPDGSVPSYIFCIENNAVFKKANEECSQIIINEGLEDAYNLGRRNLRFAEDAMIEYGLSLAPKDIKEILSKGINDDYDMRCKIIDMIFKLDTSTIDKGGSN